MAAISGFWGIFNAILIKDIIDALTVANNENIIQLLILPSSLFILNLIVFDVCWRGHDYIKYKIQPLIKMDIIEYSFSYLGYSGGGSLPRPEDGLYKTLWNAQVDGLLPLTTVAEPEQI